jgi:hypothetical protein
MAPAIKTTVKLAIACFCVGLVLYWIDFSALDVLRSVSEAVHYIVEWLGKNFAKLADIMLLGAVVVLPIALVRFGLSKLKRRRGPPPPKSRQA